MHSYRSVLEVLKFNSPKDLLKYSNCVSRLWGQVTESSELWWLLLDTFKGVSSYLQKGGPPKQRFRSFVHSSLCLITEYGLKVFSCLSDSWTSSFPLSKEVDFGTSMVFLSSERIFFCGGRGRITVTYGVTISRDAFVIEPDGEITLQASMIEARRYHGLVCHEGKIYVFGGESTTGKLSSCESFSMLLGVWNRLPDMHIKRSRLNVCVHTVQIYVCGGLHSSAEVYDTRTDLFTFLPFRLPEVTDTCCFILENRLVVLQDNYLTVWDTKSGGKETLVIEHGKRLKASGNTNPWAVDSFVWLHQREAKYVVRLDVTTLDVFRIAIPKIGTK